MTPAGPARSRRPATSWLLPCRSAKCCRSPHLYSMYRFSSTLCPGRCPADTHQEEAMTTQVLEEISVEVPVTTAYDQWTQFEEFPQFMEGVESITQFDDSHLHWVAEIAGVRREWDAKITEQTPDQRIA